MYFLELPSTNAASGHLRCAENAELPEPIPNFRASYDAVETTLRLSGLPQITTGLPLRFGLSRCSIAAKKQSMSMCMIVFLFIIYEAGTATACPHTPSLLSLHASGKCFAFP